MQSPLFDPARAALRMHLKAFIRAFFEARGSLEVDSPIAVVAPGTEVHLGYFETSWRDFGGREQRLFLRSSPELHMKQAIAHGAPRVFQMAACFRNDGELSEWHHPEFTMLEWYEAGISFDDFVTQTEELLSYTQERFAPEAKKILGRDVRPIPKTLRRITLAEAFREFVGLELLDQDPDLAKRAIALGALSPQAGDDFETAFFKLLIEKVEPGMAALGACVLCDYPPSQAALATVKGSGNDAVAKRFEIYVGRVELCNGFEELLEPELNRTRIQAANLRRQELGHAVPGEDEDFYAALARGLPACCGNALGFDRWLALLMGDASIDAAVPFRRARVWPRPV